WGLERRPLHDLARDSSLRAPAPAAQGGARSSVRDAARVFEPAEVVVLDDQIAQLARTTGVDLHIVTVKNGAGSLEERAGAYFDAQRVGERNGRGLLLYYDLALRELRVE